MKNNAILLTYTETSPNYLPLFAVALAMAVIVLGAFTRLVDAGLGCPDWPGCYGHVLWPQTSEEIARSSRLFPDNPVDVSKTWPEMVHRYFAATLGLVILLLGINAYRQRWTSNHQLAMSASSQRMPLKLPLALILLVILQGLFGMWTVTLKLWPQVVTGHLMGGFTILSLLWLLHLRLQGDPWRVEPMQISSFAAIRPLAWLALVVVAVQIALGGWTSANYAALACLDLPTCQGQWWPDTDFVEGFNFTQAIGPNYLGGHLDNDARTAIHMSHRLGALVTIVVVSTLIFKLSRLELMAAKSLSLGLACVLLLQVTLGITNILGSLPLAVAVAHNAVGALLLITLITVNYRLNTLNL